jgi:signal transduction histidine kinase
MDKVKIKELTRLLDERTMALMERESDLADRTEEIAAQQEEITAAVEEVQEKNNVLVATLKKLEERNQELDQLLYRFSHDLRSPISSILGVLGILKHETLNENQQACFDHIQIRSLQMDQVLQSLSALAKAISSDVHFVTFRIDNLVKSTVTECSTIPNFTNAKFEFRFDESVEVYSDLLLVTLMIKNLIANALTFRDPTKEGLIQIRTMVTKDMFEFEIEDNGEGVSDQTKDHIFEMFYRGSERSIGSGLGLYIVYKIVEQLKGKIDFLSSVGSTIFKIKLPSSKKF